MLLPPTIRPYWSTLLSEKASAPPHRDWEYAEDPFAARKEVDSRQEKRKEQQVRQAEFKHELKTGALGGNGDFVVRGKEVREDDGRGKAGRGGMGWTGVPEVKMTVQQREVVEGVIRKVSFSLGKKGARFCCNIIKMNEFVSLLLFISCLFLRLFLRETLPSYTSETYSTSSSSLRVRADDVQVSFRHHGSDQRVRRDRLHLPLWSQHSSSGSGSRSDSPSIEVYGIPTGARRFVHESPGRSA